MSSINPITAINMALSQNWDEAVKINKELIKKNPDDIEAMSRLAFAYIQTNEYEKAKKICKKILNLDKYNRLALKNLSKLTSIGTSHVKKEIRERVHPGLFIEEPGKTKTVLLINPAPNKVLNLLNIGDTVSIHPKKHSVEIRGADKSYYGALPDDIAFRLIKFIASGNTYVACIKNIQRNSVSVFIREMSRGKKYSQQSTFVATPIKEFAPSIQKEVKKSIITEEPEMEEEFQEESEE